jgi:hypothetical protein
MKRWGSLSLLMLGAAMFAAPLAAAQTPPTPFTTYQTEGGLSVISSCNADGKFVAYAYTPEWRIMSPPETWFSGIIQSRINGWSSSMSPEPVITTTNGVMSSALTFKNGDGTWRVWFYGVVRNTDKAQWAVVLAQPGVSASDARVTSARNEIVYEYGTNNRTFYPTYVPPPGPPARPETAKNEVVGKLKSTILLNLLKSGAKKEAREYRLMKDGYAFNIDPSYGSYVAVGKWSKQGADYKINWGTGEEVVSSACFVAAKPAPASTRTARPGCRLEPTTTTAFTTKSVCDSRGRNCTTQQVPYQQTTMQEVCR